MRRSLCFLIVACCSLPASADLIVTHLDNDAAMHGIVEAEEMALVAEGRIGDRGGAATFELDLGQTTAAPAVQAQYDWQSGQPEPFSLVYDAASGMAEFSLGGEILSYEPFGDYEEIFIRCRATREGSAVRVDALTLDGEVVGDESLADGDLGGLDILWISGGELEDGFALHGIATLSWGATVPTQSHLAFQVKVGGGGSTFTRDSSFSLLKALY